MQLVTMAREAVLSWECTLHKGTSQQAILGTKKSKFDVQICITLDCGIKYFVAMRTLNGENQPILIDEPVEFEK